MVLSEDIKTTVYFSDLLALGYPRLWGRICDAMSAYGYTAGKLTHTKDFWCRDFMPIQVGSNQYVQYIYDPDYLANTRSYKTKQDEAVSNLKDFIPMVTKSNLVIDGGNIVACRNNRGESWAIMTDKVFVENPDLSREEITSELETGLGAKVVWLPWDKEDTCGHTDGIVNFIDGSSEKPSIMAYFALYPKKIATEMRKRLKEVFDVHELKFSKDEENNWAYVNLLRTKDFILVPGLGTDSDSEALRQIELLYPNYEGRIHQVNIAPIVEKYGGAFNCLTWTVLE
jgi:agmatine/peptidylarginine deiminase